MPKQSYTKRKDDRYRVVYKGRYFYGYTQGEAVAKRDEYKQQLQAGLREAAAGVTFSTYALEWLNTYKTDCNLKTYNGYTSYINRAIEDIGDIRMLDITASDIKRLYNKQAGMSKSHIDKFCMTISAVFKAAHADGLILRNPCVNHKRPKGPAGSHRALEQWEKDLVIYMADKHAFGPAAMLMLFAGLRRGEMLAFDIDRDVDFANKRVYVRRAVSLAVNQPVVKTPKTDAGKRDLPLFQPLEDVLRDRHGLILSKATGGVSSAISFRSHWESYLYACETYLNGVQKRWYGRTKTHKAILAAGEKLPPWKSVTIRTHDFRHTFCTMLYDAGVDLKTAQKWMGHQSSRTIYRSRLFAAQNPLTHSVAPPVRIEAGFEAVLPNRTVKRGMRTQNATGEPYTVSETKPGFPDFVLCLTMVILPLIRAFQPGRYWTSPAETTYLHAAGWLRAS